MSARWSATAIAPRRVDGSALAETRYAIDPSPCPLAPAVIAIQFASVDAVHAHSRATLTATVPVPPAAAKLDDELTIDAWQRDSVGPATLVTAELPHASTNGATATTST